MPECELALVASCDKEFSLCLNLGVVLVSRLEITKDLNIWCKHDHILFATAKRHIKEAIYAIYRLCNYAWRETNQNNPGIRNNSLRKRGIKRGATRLQISVLNDLLPRPLCLNDDILFHGISHPLGLCRDLDGMGADFCRRNRETNVFHAVCADRHACHIIADAIEPAAGRKCYSNVLRRIEVVVDLHPDREDLSTGNRVREIRINEELLKYSETVLCYPDTRL